MTTTTTVAAGECCPTCGRRIPKPRKTTTTMVPSFPVVTPAAGAEALLADHFERRARRKTSSRRRRIEDALDHRLRLDEPDLVRFLNEACAGGRVARFYAAVEPGHVIVTLAGARGVFDPIPAVTLSAAALEALAPQIANGSAWQTFGVAEVAA